MEKLRTDKLNRSSAFHSLCKRFILNARHFNVDERLLIKEAVERLHMELSGYGLSVIKLIDAETGDRTDLDLITASTMRLASNVSLTKKFCAIINHFNVDELCLIREAIHACRLELTGASEFALASIDRRLKELESNDE